MQIYLVGGAIRDRLLGLDVKERDWVVVGATPEQMIADDYQQVGKDFPVFLHPQSNEEYALARTEKKSGHGYHGFDVFSAPDVTLEQDLQRRDLTINAIAQDALGKLIDPLGGLSDLNKRVLRHVSDAFIEDPLRVLRVARFHAKLNHLGFTIDPKTFRLMQEISESGELTHLTPERVWRELEKGLREKSPQVFVKTLYQCGALQALLPEVSNKFTHNDNLRDACANIGERSYKALDFAAQQNYSTGIRWAILCHGAEHLTRPKNIAAKVAPVSRQDESAVNALCQRLKIPNAPSRLATLCAMYIDYFIQAKSAKPDVVLSLFEACDAWRRPDQFVDLLKITSCLVATDDGEPHKNLASTTFLREALTLCSDIDTQQFLDQGLTGKNIGSAIYNARKMQLANLQIQLKLR